MRLGVLASHEGTTMQSVIDACRSGVIAGDVAVVISNNSGSGALRRARAAGLEAAHLSALVCGSEDELDAAVLEALLRRRVDLVVLAGFMKRLGPRTLAGFAGRIVNTHPSLLPRHGGPGMYGIHVHRAVLAAGDPVTGASVHLVTERYDEGPVLRRTEVRVGPGDTAEQLQARVQSAERELLVSTLTEIAAGKLVLEPPHHLPNSQRTEL